MGTFLGTASENGFASSVSLIVYSSSILPNPTWIAQDILPSHCPYTHCFQQSELWWWVAISLLLVCLEEVSPGLWSRKHLHEFQFCQLSNVLRIFPHSPSCTYKGPVIPCSMGPISLCFQGWYMYTCWQELLWHLHHCPTWITFAYCTHTL